MDLHNATANASEIAYLTVDKLFNTISGHVISSILWTTMMSFTVWALSHRYYKSEMSKKFGWKPAYEFRSSIPVTSALFGYHPWLGYVMAGGTILYAGFRELKTRYYSVLYLHC